MKHFFLLTLCLTGLSAFTTEPARAGELDPLPEAPPHLRYFGFAGTACGVDDPHDGIPRLNYVREVAAFTNLLHLCAHDPADAAHVAAILDQAEDLGVQAVLDVQSLFFERSPHLAGTPPSGGEPFVLRADAADRWRALAAAARLADRRDALLAVTVSDEPTWNGVTLEDLRFAQGEVEAALPEIPHLLIEAWPVVDRWVIPPETDWIGFNRYGIVDPLRDAAYLEHFSDLLARRTRPDQRVMIIFESRWVPSYGTDGLDPEHLAEVTRSYYDLARRHPEVIALVGFLWPGGLNHPDQLGARNMPWEVRLLHRQMGAAILRSDWVPRPWRRSPRPFASPAPNPVWW